MIPEALPPYRHISSTVVSLSTASSLLDTYVSNSKVHAHLHPDATITPSGVKHSPHGGPMGGIIMHNLRRVAAGLRGEYLEPEATPEPEETEEQDGNAARWKKEKRPKAKKRSVEGEDPTTNGEDVDGWQNMSEYEREEGRVEVAEIDHSDDLVRFREDVLEEEGTIGTKREGASKKRKATDKDERKRAKKERNKVRKKDNMTKKG